MRANLSKIIVVAAALVFTSRCKEPIKTGIPQVSKSTTDSSQKGALVAEYSITSIDLDTTRLKLDLRFEEAWVENGWQYINQNADVVVSDSPKLVLHPLESQVIDDLLETWMLCIDDRCKCGSASGNIIVDLPSVTDTIRLALMKLRAPYRYNQSQAIGYITLVRK